MNAMPATTPTPDLSIEEAVSRAYAHWNAGQTDQAELFCQRVLASWPGHSDASHLMGLMAHAYGNLDLAIAHLRQACQAPRAPAIYFSNLAEMCRQKGLLAEAEQAGRRAIALDAGLVAGWSNLGIILQETGKLEESRSCLEWVIGREPGNAEAHNNLGNTCKRMGLLTPAASHYAKALELKRDYAEAHSNYANLLNDIGHYDEAAAAARRAIDINPRLADAYVNLAAVETTRGRHGEALRWLDSLLSFAPLHGGALSARALTLKQLDRLEEALDSANRAVNAGRDNAECYNGLGQILQALGRTEEALAAFERAIALPGTATEGALSHRAVLLMESGRKEEAIAAFDQALEAFPRSAQAWFNRSDIKTFTPGDPDIARMEALLGPGGVQGHADRMALHFGLGKAYLDIGESERAFHYLNEGNRMKRAGFQFDAKATSEWMGSIASAFAPTLMKKLSGSGAASPLPVFVLGMPRSGTSLIEQILASHGAVYGAGELSIVQKLVESLGDYPAGVAKLTKARLAEMGEAYLAKVQPLAQGQRHVVDKMPANFLHAGLIRLMLPEAKIIHCRRDPADIGLSCYSKLFSAEQLFAYDLAEMGQFLLDYRKLTDHWRKVLPADRFIDVDYEAVVEDIEGEARRLTDFLGLPWDPACIAFHQNKRVVKTASVNQVRQPIYRTSRGRWKAHAEQLKPMLDVLGSVP